MSKENNIKIDLASLSDKTYLEKVKFIHQVTMDLSENKINESEAERLIEIFFAKPEKPEFFNPVLLGFKELKLGGKNYMIDNHKVFNIPYKGDYIFLVNAEFYKTWFIYQTNIPEYKIFDSNCFTIVQSVVIESHDFGKQLLQALRIIE